MPLRLKTSRMATCHPDQQHRGYGMCNTCYSKWYATKNRPQVRKTVSNGYYKLKSDLIAAYGGKCECCGETEPVFLSLEHKNGGGNEHRKRAGSGYAIWCELKRLGFPQDDYTILCMNCQRGVMRPEGCPHQRKSNG